MSFRWGSAAQKAAQLKAARASAEKRRVHRVAEGPASKGDRVALAEASRGGTAKGQVPLSEAAKLAKSHRFTADNKHADNKAAYAEAGRIAKRLKATMGEDAPTADNVYSSAKKLHSYANGGLEDPRKAGNERQQNHNVPTGKKPAADRVKAKTTVPVEPKDRTTPNSINRKIDAELTRRAKEASGRIMADHKAKQAADHRAKSFSQNARGVSMSGRSAGPSAPSDMSKLSDRELGNGVLDAKTASEKSAYSKEIAKRNLSKHFPDGIAKASDSELQSKLKDGTTPSSVKSAIDTEMTRREKKANISAVSAKSMSDAALRKRKTDPGLSSAERTAASEELNRRQVAKNKAAARGERGFVRRDVKSEHKASIAEHNAQQEYTKKFTSAVEPKKSSGPAMGANVGVHGLPKPLSEMTMVELGTLRKDRTTPNSINRKIDAELTRRAEKKANVSAVSADKGKAKSKTPTFEEFQARQKAEQAALDKKNGVKGAGLYDTTGRPKKVGSTMEWKSGSYGSTSGDPRSEAGAYRISRKSDGSEYELHHETLTGYGDNAKRTSKSLGTFQSEESAKIAASNHSGLKNAKLGGDDSGLHVPGGANRSRRGARKA